MNLKTEVIKSISIAIEGREFLKHTWETELKHYDDITRTSRIREITEDIKSLRSLRTRVKKRKRL